MKEKNILESEHSCFLKNGPLISVVVPVYNMEKFLSRCVDSILRQTYESLEIILVDDCSTDESAKIIKQYIERDDRIKSVSHKKNMGLFQARISGIKVAHGKYLAFVDSDDYLSVDWFRTLAKKAEETDADITVGEWCFDFNGRIEYCNFDPFRMKDYILEGDQILKTFMMQEGRSFSWTILVNKLYRKDLWNRCLPDFVRFSKEHGHMLMWEDITFSSGLWTHANKVVNVHNIYYYYYKHREAATSLEGNRNRKRCLKYISDASSAMNFMQSILISANRYEEMKEDFLNWKNRYASMVYQEIVVDLGQARFEKNIRSSFDFYGPVIERSNFFYSPTTKLNPSFMWLEALKREIVSTETKYVSFDIFDTLIQRPFFRPMDMFILLSDEMNKATGSYIDFGRIRVEAEKHCRSLLATEFPSREEITLNDIYNMIAQNYTFSKEMLEHMKKREEELEIEFSYARKIGKELFELSLDAGKEILICSDMYLPKGVIERILNKSGYRAYKKLYVSSDLHYTKSNKSLFRYIQRDLHCKNPSDIIHIGDNWISDIENARACGFRVGHVFKATDIFQNDIPGVYSGEAYRNIFIRNNGCADNLRFFNDFVGVRSIAALAANKIFDNPFVSYNELSDFNADPNFIGYFAFGPHLLSVALWIKKLAIERDIPKIHFVARDGYMVKQAFDVINASTTATNYIRLSRRSLILADINDETDLYSLSTKLNILNCSPLDLEEYLSPIIPDERAGHIPQIMKEHNLYYDRKFEGLVEFERCIRAFIEEIVDISRINEYKETLRTYFSQFVKPGDYIFDIGYSGRAESALSNILGYPIGSLYIHVNSDIAAKRQAKYQCAAESFYSFKPRITGGIREHLLMELGPTTIGYEEINNVIVPKLDKYKLNYENDLVTQIVQQAAIEFVKDFYRIFQNRLVLPLDTLSAPFEYYLHFSKPFDRQIFSTLEFEDKLGMGRKVNALTLWNREIEMHDFIDCGGISVRSLPLELADIYEDGLFVKFYKAMNKWFPKGGKLRNMVKRFAAIFIH